MCKILNSTKIRDDRNTKSIEGIQKSPSQDLDDSRGLDILHEILNRRKNKLSQHEILFLSPSRPFIILFISE